MIYSFYSVRISTLMIKLTNKTFQLTTHKIFSNNINVDNKIANNYKNPSNDGENDKLNESMNDE